MEPNSWLGVEVRHFAALQALAHEGSFGRAARQLGYTQSAVSQQIATLERIVGERLVERPGGPRAVSLTEAGALLLRHAESIVARLQAAQADLRALQAGEAGTLTVGTFQSVGARVLPELMRRFTQQWPQIEVMLDELEDEEIVGAIERGQLDVGFVVLPVGEAPLETVELLRDPYVLIVAAESPLARTRPTLHQVAELPLVGFRDSPARRAGGCGVSCGGDRAPLGVPFERQPDRAGARRGGRRRCRDAAPDGQRRRSAASPSSSSRPRCRRGSSPWHSIATGTARPPRAPSCRLRARWRYSTVTVLARLRGWSTFRPRKRAIRYASSCNGRIASAACRKAGDSGT